MLLTVGLRLSVFNKDLRCVQLLLLTTLHPAEILGPLNITSRTMSVPSPTRSLLRMRLLPKKRPPERITTRLSILDSVAAPFPPSNGLWIYDKPQSKTQAKALVVPHLLQ
jgi:hypothetical protein